MRKIASAGLFFVLFSLLFPQVFAQELRKTFVSKVDAELKNGYIRLSWMDSPDIQGPVYIYRSMMPFPKTSDASLPYPIAVPYGVQSYIDEADRPGTYYYFAAASDDTGKKYISPRPYDNILSVTVGREDTTGYVFLSGSSREFHGPRPSAALPGESGGGTLFRDFTDYLDERDPLLFRSSSLDTGIRELRAAVENDRVLLSFSGSGKDAVLYRSPRPIRTREDLVQSVIAGRGAQSPFVDYPVPGIPYFYALILEEELSSGSILLGAGANVTASPVEVPPGSNRIGFSLPAEIRPLPVPAMNADPAKNPPSAPLSEETLKALEVITGSFDTAVKEPGGMASPIGTSITRQIPFREPDVFMEDLEMQTAGEQAQLGMIVQGSFSALNWEKTAEELRAFLSLPHSAPVTGRARFYLGQAYYFTGTFRESLSEFLAAHSAYPNESNPWIEMVLMRLSE
jgi:hypothetical protein